jgi:hypothetical protein
MAVTTVAAPIVVVVVVIPTVAITVSPVVHPKSLLVDVPDDVAIFGDLSEHDLGLGQPNRKRQSLLSDRGSDCMARLKLLPRVLRRLRCVRCIIDRTRLVLPGSSPPLGLGRASARATSRRFDAASPHALVPPAS